VEAGSETSAEMSAGSEGGMKIGMSLADYSNPVWADVSKAAEELCKANGAEYTAVQFDNDPQKQVSQIENFVSSGYSGIILSPTDPGSIEDACKAAMEKGVAVVVYGAELENMTCNYNVPEYEAGYAAGQLAADWVETREALMAKDKIEIGILNYRQTPQTIGREDGFEAAMKERVPSAEIVIRTEALTAEEGMKATETFFQAHPNLDIIYSIGGGGGMGANEAVKAMNKDAADFGIFCVDSTQEICQAIKNGEGLKGIISLGSGREHGEAMVNLAMEAAAGEKVEFNNFMPIIPVNSENVEEFAEENGYTLT
jgi:ribose transport system substrate-binding protein